MTSPSTTGTDSYVTDFSHGKLVHLETLVVDVDDNDMDKKPPAKKTTPATSDFNEDHSSENRTNDGHNLVETSIVLTPKQTNVNPLPQIVSVTNSLHFGDSTPSNQPKHSNMPDHDALPEGNEIAWTTKDEAPGFRQVHYRLFETVTTWFQLEETDKHPFHSTWRKVLYNGLEATSN